MSLVALILMINVISADPISSTTPGPVDREVVRKTILDDLNEMEKLVNKLDELKQTERQENGPLDTVQDMISDTTNGIRKAAYRLRYQVFSMFQRSPICNPMKSN